jgi:UDP-N-acetylmuramoyl-L-alanyl-D-glutamate--2,6-diaminopimelate ligase
MKRPIMWEIVSRLSDTTIVTQDDDYSEKTQIIIKDVLSGIDKKEWEWLWVIPDREEAIRTALISAKENDIVLVAGKWDEHTMVTNKWIVEWHDKTIIQKLLQEIDDNKIL